MSHELIANIWYFILALVWAIYVSQELFVTGVGMLSLRYRVEEDSFAKINESVATFWDGIQVWLIVAVGGLFATFPAAYGLTLQALYVPFYLLLIAVIFRGTSIELVYKSDDALWQKAVSKVWGVASFAMILIVGIYLVNLFTGLPIKNNLMTENFTVIFSRSAQFGGALFVLSALTMGYCWIKMTLGKEFKTTSKVSSLWISGASLFSVALLFLALTNKNNVFETGYFAKIPALWAMPILAMLFYVLQFVFMLKDKYVGAFVSIILGISLVIFTGFSAAFPYILPSTIAQSEGLTIMKAASSQHTLEIITGVTLVFLPVVIVYQGWKYRKFWRKF